MTSYLIRKRMAAEQPLCPIGENCFTVLSSKYNRIFFGAHNDILGMIFYVFFAAVSALLVLETEFSSLLALLAKIALLGATATSAAFVYLQWKVIKAWCFWCVASSATIGLMDIIVIFSKEI